MRIERWYWLIAFCLVSLMIHAGVAFESRTFYTVKPPQKPTEIEVALEPLKEPPAPKVEQKVTPPAPTPKPPPGLTDKQLAAIQHPKVRMAKATPAVIHPKAPGRLRVVKVEKSDLEKRPVAPSAEPGGIEKLKNETPITAGLPTGVKDAGEPKLPRIVRNAIPGGGGSPAPGPIPGGHGGARGPEAPPEDIVYNGGGAGGVKLPRAAPRIGGGGGASILSVENPLAKEAIPEEKPGLGPGLSGGQGAGAGAGVGYGRGKGIGTRLDGTVAIGTLHAKPGPGIGAGAGRNIGTKPPGGGRGTGAELPGTGGTGSGYGRGSGTGIGNGSGIGVGDGSGARPGKVKGVPFGDVAGLLRGDPNGGGGKGGGPGGPGRGALFNVAPTGGGGGGALHICYLIDVSGSMREGNPSKIDVAKRELTRVLRGLKPQDQFCIVAFWGRVAVLDDKLVPATKDNIDEAVRWVSWLRTGDATNLSAALNAAFSLNGLTDIDILSDGEPTVGIRRPQQLLDYVQQVNEKKIRITALAIGQGETFRGMALLKALADNNGGKYSYIDVNNLPVPAPGARDNGGD